MTSPLSAERLQRAYRQMKTIREFEERLHVEIATGEIPGFTHLYAGQEAVAVGVCEHLDDADYIVSTHRGHGHCIAKGCDVQGMMLEIYGRADGLCKGKGGSMHIADVTKGMLGANAIVGGGPPLAVGAAIACRNRGNQRVSIAFGGDGSCNQGTVFEAMNMAVVLKVPAIFVIEDNGYSEHTGKDYAVGSKDIAGRARGFGMPAERCDGSDFFAVYEAAGRLIEQRAPWRRPCDPRGDDHALLRALRRRPAAVPREGRSEAPARDDGLPEEFPRARDGRRLVVGRHARRHRRAGADGHRRRRCGSEVVAAAGRVRTRNRRLHLLLSRRAMPQKSFRDALNEALHLEMERDGSIIVLGEDVSGGAGGTSGQREASGGIFGVTKGLLPKFGADRVIDTPISESAIIGAAGGAALAGLRPVAELMFADFVGVSMDQIFNQMAKFRYMFGGKTRCPAVVRLAMGAGMNMGAQHSQSIYALLTAVPGLKVVVPSNAYDAKGLLIQAIRDDDPVMFFEHKALYPRKGEVPDGAYTIPFGEANLLREGEHVTVVAIGRMVVFAEKVVDTLAKEGITCDLIDPRTTSPLDEETILESVENTGRLVVVDESNPRCSVAADICAHRRGEGLPFAQGRTARGDGAALPGAVRP